MPEIGPGDEDVADPQRAALDEHGRERAAALVEPGLDHRAFGGAVGIGLQLEQFGLERDRLEQFVEAGLLERGDLDVLHLAGHLLDHHLVLEQLLADLLGIGAGLVDLVDRHDHRHAGRLGVVDRLDRLRHQPVVGRHHQDDDVGDVGAARAHLGERLVARRVEEGDLRLVRQRDLIGADMLGDAAGLAGDDVGAADRVEQAGLAVIDMAHDRDHRRARLQRPFGIDIGLGLDVDVGFADALDVVAELGDQQLGRVLVDHLVDGDRHAHLEQRLDQVGGALGHAVGELADGDRFGHDDVADLLGRRAGLLMGALFLLARALQRRQRTGAGIAVLARARG